MIDDGIHGSQALRRRDIRQTVLYQETEALYNAVRQPGTGQISDAAEVHVSPDGRLAVFSGVLVDELKGTPPSRICQVDLTTGETRVLTFGPNVDRLPKWSPDGRQIAFLSDRHSAGDFQLYLLDVAGGAARAAARVDGWVEYYHWSPDGTCLLLGVAGHGADTAGGHGAIASRQRGGQLPSWMPAVDTGDEGFRWRRVWVCAPAVGTAYPVGPPDTNVWEAAWCGNDAFLAVTSAGPAEGLWYSARLELIAVGTAQRRNLFAPGNQVGWPSASPSGRHVAFVEAICSDRWSVAGDLWLMETASGTIRTIETCEVDISSVEWRSDEVLLLAGQRGFDTVVGRYDLASDAFTELWSSRDITAGLRLPTVSGMNETGDCVMVGESFVHAPEIALVRDGKYRTVRSFDLGYSGHATAIAAVEYVSWTAPDGLTIQGYLLRPRQPAPHPIVMNIHGGPVWLWRTGWLGRPRTVPFLMLVKRGFAVFYPNPRGSVGRGQAFARRVKGDMNGKDTNDFLSGLDSLTDRGIADPRRIGVTGVSYGGGMSSWLITQDPRFTAAVPVAPHTNQVTEHLISNIPQFMSLFLEDTYTNIHGRYLERSPVMHATRVKSPTLNICGALDRCTPPEEAMQFHSALLESGAKSMLVTYPEEGHGIHSLPAAIDYAARLVGWFEEHMPADNWPDGDR